MTENKPAALCFDRYAFAYPDAEPVLTGVDWAVPEGAFSLLVGDTGSGKTTLLRQAKPAMAPTGQHTGTCVVFGKNVSDLGDEEAAALVGYVSQSPDNQLVCDTVWHEMAFGLENLGTPQADMSRRVAEVAHYFGIGPWFHQEVNSLSGGQKQLLNLASVLVMQPRLLLLDEPTAQLDPVAAANFCHALFRLNRELGLTVVAATHTPELFADYATEAVRLEKGQVHPVSLDSLRPRLCGSAQTQGPNCAQASCAGAQASVPVVMARDVYVRYEKNAPFVLRGADLQIYSGRVHALAGGNGCGKTTLLKTLAGLLKPSRGTVRNALGGSQALLPQNPQTIFVCDTVIEELMEWSATCGYGQAEVDAWLARIGLATHLDAHPYDLSGGQMQLLAFTKIALTRPRLLLLDEPAKGLDPRSKLLLGICLRDLAASGTTVVMATHDLAFAACVADDASLIFDGQIVCAEPVEDFFAHNLFYRPMGDAFSQLWEERSL